MAAGDELTLALLPKTVSGLERPRTIGLPAADLDSLTEALVGQGVASAADKDRNLYVQIVGRVEKEVIAQVMRSCDNVQIKAAARLGINRNTLHKKLREHGLNHGGS